MRLALFFVSANMLSRFPTYRTENLISEIDGFLVRDRGDGVVPAVQIAPNSNYSENFKSEVSKLHRCWIFSSETPILWRWKAPWD